MEKKKRLLDEYRFSGFRPRAGIQGIFGDPRARVIQLKRRQKKQYVAVVVRLTGDITTRRYAGYEIYLAAMLGFIWMWRFGEYVAESARK